MWRPRPLFFARKKRFAERVVLVGVLMVTLLSSARTSHAADPLRERVMSAVARIVNKKSEESCVGSGTVVARQQSIGVVLTCAHLFTEGVGDITIIGRGGEPKRALLVALDEKNDLACLFVHLPEGATLGVAKELPGEGAALSSCGFGQAGDFKTNHGACIGYATLSGGETLGVLEITGEARHGDSGGPILNARAEVVAVIMGTDGKTVDGTHCGLIRDFLALHPVTAELRAKAAELAAASDEPLVALDVSFEGSTDGELD